MSWLEIESYGIGRKDEGQRPPGGCRLFMMAIECTFTIYWDEEETLPSELGERNESGVGDQDLCLDRFSWRHKAATLVFLSSFVPSSFQPTGCETHPQDPVCTPALNLWVAVESRPWWKMMLPHSHVVGIHLGPQRAHYPLVSSQLSSPSPQKY